MKKAVILISFLSLFSTSVLAGERTFSVSYTRLSLSGNAACDSKDGGRDLWEECKEAGCETCRYTYTSGPFPPLRMENGSDYYVTCKVVLKGYGCPN